MGYIRHRAIIVTSCDEACISEAHRLALKIWDATIEVASDVPWSSLVSPLLPSLTNGYVTFFIAPDGSKEGWDVSEHGDARRKVFLDALANINDPWRIDWYELCYGGDDSEIFLVTRPHMHGYVTWEP